MKDEPSMMKDDPSIRMRYALIGFVSALALGAVAAGSVALWRIVHPTSSPSSAIRVVGGSIKFHSNSAWNVAPNCNGQPCIVSRGAIDVSQLAVEDSGQVSHQLSNFSSWIVTVRVSTANGSSISMTKGTKIYPSDSNGLCTTVHNPDPNHPGQFIDTCRVTAAQMNVAASTLVPSTYLVADSYDMGANSPHVRYRYQDPNCTPNSADYSEMLRTVTVNYVPVGGTVVQTSATVPCDDGQCKVYVGP